MLLVAGASLGLTQWHAFTLRRPCCLTCLHHCPACVAGSFLDQQPLLQQLVPDEQHGNSFELPSINPRNAGLPYR